jgi:hypothetical protein
MVWFAYWHSRLRDYFEELDIDVMIILKCILDVKWTELSVDTVQWLAFVRGNSLTSWIPIGWLLREYCHMELVGWGYVIRFLVV